MQTTTYTTRVLTAEDGFKITNAQRPQDPRQCLIAAKVYLAVNDSADNYTEITDAEAEAVRAEAERLDREEAEQRRTE